MHQTMERKIVQGFKCILEKHPLAKNKLKNKTYTNKKETSFKTRKNISPNFRITQGAIKMSTNDNILNERMNL